MLSTAADFSFWVCPIFHVDILGTTPEPGVEPGPLSCCVKCQCEILAASRKPTQLHPNPPEHLSLLPTMPSVSWVWRKTSAMQSTETPPNPCWMKFPKLHKGEGCLHLSTQKRERRLLEIQNAEEWRRWAWAALEAEQAHSKEQT